MHSLEHGAVWITYKPGLPEKQINSLRRLAQRQNYVLLSLYPGLSEDSPVVVSAWGRQLRLEGAYDSRLDRFVRAFRRGPQAPERGGPITGRKGRAGVEFAGSVSQPEQESSKVVHT